MEAQDLSPFCSSQSILRIRINKREKPMHALQEKTVDNVSISVKNCILNRTVSVLFLTYVQLRFAHCNTLTVKVSPFCC